MTAGPAKAQSLSSAIRVHVPFDFIVADRTLPAGDYSISRTTEYTNDLVLAVKKVDGGKMAVRLTSPVQTLTPAQVGKLVFHRYGEQYFLSQVWPAGSTTGRALVKCNVERGMEQKAPATTRVKSPVIETVSLDATAR